FDEGGLNYGNRRILGRMTEPIPGPTALALLALQGQDGHRVTAAFGYLKQVLADSTDLEHLGYAALACDAHRGRPGVAGASERCAGRTLGVRAGQEKLFGAPPGPPRLALAALALTAPAHNPFRRAAAAADGDGNGAVPPGPRRPGLLSRIK